MTKLESTAKKALQRHSWYLSKQGLALVFFDKRLSSSDWEAIVKNLSPTTTSKALKKFKKKTTLSKRLFELMTKKSLEASGVFAGKMVSPKVEHVLQNSQT